MKLKPFGFIRSLGQYFRDSYKEFKQVTWPTRQTITQYTILVTITIVVGALIVTAFDFGLQQITNRYLIR